MNYVPRQNELLSEQLLDGEEEGDVVEDAEEAAAPATHVGRQQLALQYEDDGTVTKSEASVHPCNSALQFSLNPHSPPMTAASGSQGSGEPSQAWTARVAEPANTFRTQSLRDKALFFIRTSRPDPR